MTRAYAHSVRGRRHRWSIVAVASGLVAVPLVALALHIDEGATVDVPAERGDAFQATDTIPPPPGCDRVAVIGDSLMDNAEPWLRGGLRDAGFTYFVDAQPSRRIPERVRAPYSGVRAALAARASWGEADCWLIALGSNDLFHGAGEAATANSMFDEMLGAITPGAIVWWVNVDYHSTLR